MSDIKADSSNNKHIVNPKKNKQLIRHWLTAHPFLLFLLGLVLILLFLVFENKVCGGTKIVVELFREVGIAFIIASTVTFLIEVADFRDYFSSRLTDILIRDEYLSCLDEKKLIDLKIRLEAITIFKESGYDPMGLYGTIQELTHPLLTECCYDKYCVFVKAEFIEMPELPGVRLIKKRIIREFTINNKSKIKIEDTIPLKTVLSKINGIADEKLLSITKVEVNSKDVTSDIQPTAPLCKPNENGDDDVHVTCNFPVPIDSNENLTIHVISETITPETDLQYTHKVGRPCKHLRVQYEIVNMPEYKVIGSGFGFGKNAIIHSRSLTNGLEIEIDEWTLPGHGVIFTLAKK